MAITITRADVKRKCMISTDDNSYNAAIDDLISEMQPAIECFIAEEYLEDTSNMRLQAALKLGILELISAEFLEQMAREEGCADDFSIGSLNIAFRKDYGVQLRASGEARLQPYLKAQLPFMSDSAPKSSNAEAEPIFCEAQW